MLFNTIIWHKICPCPTSRGRGRMEAPPRVSIYYSFNGTFHIFKVLFRPSDRVRGCGTAPFGQTRTITHNSQNPAKSRTILKDLLKHLIKSRLLLITKIPKNFLGYFQAIYLLKQLRNPSLSSVARADIKRKAFFRHSVPAWALVSVRSTFSQLR